MDTFPKPPKPGDGLAHCPIESCPWILDIEASRTGVFTQVPDTATLLEAIRKNADGAIRQHLETHTLPEWVQEVSRLRGELEAARIQIVPVPGASDLPT